MAEKATPGKRVRFKFTYNPGAGSSAGGGGGDGDGAAAAPAPVPRRGPRSSSPRSPSPPRPSTCNPGAGSSGGAGGGGAAGQELSYSPPPLSPSSADDEVSDAAGPEVSYSPPSLSWSSSSDEASDDEESGEVKRRNGWGSLFMSDPQVLSMFMSDPQVLSMYSSDNLPDYVGRQDCEPLSTQEFFSLRHNWQQLLDGKKTYLRPPKNNCVAKDNYANCLFVTPEPLEKALQCQGSLSDLVRAAAGNPIIQQKYKILSEHYVCFRPIRNDGSQFYRAFLFSYLENLGKMQCSQAEVTRLMECMARSRENFCRLQWNNAYFSNPEAFFSSVVSEFEHLVNSVANGLNADELYKISLQEISSSRILCLLRLLTEVHIRTHEVDCNRLLIQKINALLFCIKSVRPFDSGIEVLQMRALPQTLGIPVHVALVDVAMNNGTVQVKCYDFVPLPESGISRRSRPLSTFRNYYISSSTDKHPVLPAGNLFSSDRMPLVTILMCHNATAILYRK